MPNQRELAKVLGISQSAVSLALRGDASISEALRKRVRTAAKRVGYRSNPYVRALMSSIRTDRKPCDQGAMALVVDVFREKEWREHPSYSVYYHGLARRCSELGFQLECFFLMDSGMCPSKVDAILYARGIRGVILAPPYLGNRKLGLIWNRYACVGTGYGWEHQQFDRVGHDHDQNVVTAFEKLRELGYLRIGMCLPSFYVNGRGTRWLDGYLVCQHRLQKGGRIPLFIGSEEEKSFPGFREWYLRWRPDVVLGLYGEERRWLDAMGLRIPEETGLACLIRPRGSRLAGIDDRFDHIGAATAELVASKISFNQLGIPSDPKLILVEGRWVDGRSLRKAKGIQRKPSSS